MIVAPPCGWVAAIDRGGTVSVGPKAAVPECPLLRRCWWADPALIYEYISLQTKRPAQGPVLLTCANESLVTRPIAGVQATRTTPMLARQSVVARAPTKIANTASKRATS
jgi:hypothetical protein